MDWNQNPYMSFPGMTPEEYAFLQQGTAELTESQKRYFTSVYAGKRKNPSDMLIFSLVGICLVPGLQRFMVGQIGMGLLYLFTGGLCVIGSIVDAVNYRSLTDEYNRKMAYESFQIAKMAA